MRYPEAGMEWIWGRRGHEPAPEIPPGKDKEKKPPDELKTKVASCNAPLMDGARSAPTKSNV